ncbi:MAG: ComEC/Rec2 family competence protein [Acidimicrobiia bacterium]|nr:ComEC/Rec2 family competence protein [Acidimicrobiia bacterium]
MGGQLPDDEPQSEARCDSDRDGAQPRRNRHAERHEHGAARHEQRKANQASQSPRQEQQHATAQRHTGSTNQRDDTTASPQHRAIGDDATWYRHVRHVMRSHNTCLALMALGCIVSARLGIELSSRSPEVVVRASAVWWLLAAAALSTAVWRALANHTITVAVTVALLVFSAHGASHWNALSTPHLGEFSGVATAVSDAQSRRGAVTLVVKVAGERFRLTQHGTGRGALLAVRTGDLIVLDAQRSALDARRLRFAAGRHVQGELRDVTIHSVHRAVAPWHRAANRVHALIDRGLRTTHPHDAALARGLVLGDDSGQPARMTEVFRASGLGHLLAVSGQNVALLLASLTPGLRRLSRWWRLSASLGIIAFFALVTRFEPSVVRAATMAAVVQVGFAVGRDALPLRALAITVMLVVVVDPLATVQIGFLLSVAATTGLVVLAPQLSDGVREVVHKIVRHLVGVRVTKWMAEVVTATLAAQLAVAPFSLWWFGALPSVSLVANPLAVPVASLVMTTAVPLLAIAAVVPDPVAVVVVAPVVACVRWVWWVAELGARVGPRGAANVAMWLLVLLGLARAVWVARPFTLMPRWRGAYLSRQR